MDTIIGDKQTEAILTITERKTNFIMMKKLPHGRNSRQVSKEVIALLRPYKDKLKTITTDNGSEFADHQEITRRLSVPVYFTDPYSSWQKRAVENANKLINQYIPKRVSFKEYSTRDVREIQYRLNERPREKLDFNSSKVEFYKQFE